MVGIFVFWFVCCCPCDDRSVRGTECSLFILFLSLCLYKYTGSSQGRNTAGSCIFHLRRASASSSDSRDCLFFFVNPEMHLASTRPEHGTLLIVSCCRNVGSRIFPFAERIEINKGSARPDRVTLGNGLDCFHGTCSSRPDSVGKMCGHQSE